MLSWWIAFGAGALAATCLLFFVLLCVVEKTARDPRNARALETLKVARRFLETIQHSRSPENARALAKTGLEQTRIYSLGDDDA